MFVSLALYDKDTGVTYGGCQLINPFKPEFTIVIFIHCRNFRLVVDEDDLKWVESEKKSSLLKQIP